MAPGYWRFASWYWRIAGVSDAVARAAAERRCRGDRHSGVRREGRPGPRPRCRQRATGQRGRSIAARRTPAEPAAARGGGRGTPRGRRALTLARRGLQRSDVTILALDTTTHAGSVAIRRDGARRGARRPGDVPHARRLPGEMLDLLGDVRPVARGRDALRGRLGSWRVHRIADRHRHHPGPRVRASAGPWSASRRSRRSRTPSAPRRVTRHAARRRVDGCRPPGGVHVVVCRRRSGRRS